MKAVIEYFGCLYLPGNWLVILLSLLYGFSNYAYVGIVGLSLGFYILKLRYINNMSFSDFNYRTVAYYLVFYVCFFVVGIIVGSVIYFVFRHVSPDLFAKLFPIDKAFYVVANRLSLTGTSILIVGWVLSGMHRHYRSLRFANKVGILEVVMVCVSLTGLMIHPHFIGMFVSTIVFNTAPSFVKLIVGRLMSSILQKDIDLVNRKIENYHDSDLFIKDRSGYIDGFRESILVVIVDGGMLHLKLALAILLIGGPIIMLRYYY